MTTRKNIFFSLSLIAFFLFSACNSNKKVSSPDQRAYFVVGEGGGFAGSYEQYRINQDGLIEVYNFKEKNYSTVTKVKSKEVNSFFESITDLNLAEIELRSPGNMSQYIEITYENMKDHKLVWEKRKNSVSPELQALFDTSFAFCKDQLAPTY